MPEQGLARPSQVWARPGHALAWPSLALQGGLAIPGLARPGVAWPCTCLTMPELAWPGQAKPGWARPGLAWLGQEGPSGLKRAPRVPQGPGRFRRLVPGPFSNFLWALNSPAGVLGAWTRALMRPQWPRPGKGPQMAQGVFLKCSSPGSKKNPGRPSKDHSPFEPKGVFLTGPGPSSMATAHHPERVLNL